MLTTPDGKVPIHYWDLIVNFGDLLAPWLTEKMTGKEAVLIKEGRDQPHYVLVGSILSHVRSGSIVWGTGSFGTETKKEICLEAEYLAVRGPLTRTKILVAGGQCPPVYGDPGLLVADFYRPDVDKAYDVGVIIRHSEEGSRRALEANGIKVIHLKNDKIEQTLDEICSCRNIISSSLHGLIIADAYGIPNAWLESRTPYGRDFKYWDYLISVDKIRDPKPFKFNQEGVTAKTLLEEFQFDARPIKLNLDALRKSNPFGWA